MRWLHIGISVTISGCLWGFVNYLEWRKSASCVDCFFPRGVPFAFYRDGGFQGRNGIVWMGLAAGRKLGGIEYAATDRKWTNGLGSSEATGHGNQYGGGAPRVVCDHQLRLPWSQDEDSGKFGGAGSSAGSDAKPGFFLGTGRTKWRSVGENAGVVVLGIRIVSRDE